MASRHYAENPRHNLGIAVQQPHLPALYQRLIVDRIIRRPGPLIRPHRIVVFPPLRHVLVGLNAHLNYDLPQAFLAVVTDDEFDDPTVLAKRQRDFAHIDDIVVARVKEEDEELKKVEEPGDRTMLDRLLTPFNRLASKRFLKEARAKVWRNAGELSRARRRGPDAYAARLRQLEEVSKAKVEELLAPGQVLLRLAAKGYGVLLPPDG